MYNQLMYNQLMYNIDRYVLPENFTVYGKSAEVDLFVFYTICYSLITNPKLDESKA
jgi:hypothetical protein